MWSVAFNPLVPTLVASGSDDGTIKLWNMGQSEAVLSLPAKTSICSVKFNPHSRYMLACGVADHGVHYVASHSQAATEVGRTQESSVLCRLYDPQ